MIEISGTVNEKPMTFKMEVMSPTDTAMWGGRLQSRINYAKALKKEVELLEAKPVAEVDPKVLLKLKDTYTDVSVQVIKVACELADHAITPTPDDVKRLLNDFATAADVTAMLLSYVSKLVPSQAEQKKS